ncbi:hypothetical protein BDP27DRAFT_1373469 [Rhodocollybia butyracea]|uniref:Uncharacterized protein n=1 Tax=Rhodocollybia butyracea TaxID=206335 RepID=A0A9P5P7V4_9AGAR|nr:hypothetical protein BDP27DRAFT_1373469 [Rhodocollybia butyracea]
MQNPIDQTPTTTFIGLNAIFLGQHHDNQSQRLSFCGSIWAVGNGKGGSGERCGDRVYSNDTDCTGVQGEETDLKDEELDSKSLFLSTARTSTVLSSPWLLLRSTCKRRVFLILASVGHRASAWQYIAAEDIDPLEYKRRQHSNKCLANRKHGRELFLVGKTLKFEGAAIIQWNTSDVK